MVEGTSTELVVLQRDIEMTRQEIAAAVEDLEVAAKRLASKEHWKGVGHDVYRARPWVFLGISAALGFYLGTKVWPRIPAPIGPEDEEA